MPSFYNVGGTYGRRTEATVSNGRGLWRDIGRLGILLAGLAVLYTLYALASGQGAFFAWINTLLSTLFSVFAALVIGLLLFNHQTRETDCKKKAELSRLLKSEVSEVREAIEGLRTVVPDQALKGDFAHAMRVSMHYAHPLVVEEAARSGLFDEPQTRLMLRLARDMRAHQVRVQDAMTVGFWTQMSQLTNRHDLGSSPDRYMDIRYAETVRSVQRAEERIIEGCEALLADLEGEAQETV